MRLIEEVTNGTRHDPKLRRDGTLVFGNRFFVPQYEELKKEILDEAHIAPYALHLGFTKMYHTIKTFYYRFGMKRDIAKYVRRCFVCQQVKA